ncbi:YifB family Mg chelatase-like AAA ATPase, partial [Candidatus Berkelbacteria bacterium]|nr:YifB family Mg chelatase-like AAA ATPase [Candidatus Berkelbacteria bacterium]
ADKSVEESRERIRSALKFNNFNFPLSRITVNLSPSNIKKTGIHFDLPIALAILTSNEQLKLTDRASKTVFIGGLSLDGELQPVPGVLVMVDWAKSNGITEIVIPKNNLAEASLISGVNIYALKNFSEVMEYIEAESISPSLIERKYEQENYDEDWLQIKSQQLAKRSAVIAATGGHNLLLSGPPGAGKSLIAKGLRALLPQLTEAELIEVVKIHSISSLLKQSITINTAPPFRSPHHTASYASIIGGGAQAKPGEISLAHRGVLLLDELPEFSRQVLETLRQPLEDGTVNVSRMAVNSQYPCNFILVATMNPCPCGWLGSDQKECVCTINQINLYSKRISGPLLDRIDLCVRVNALKIAELGVEARENNLSEIKALIIKARERQLKRNNGKLNAHLSASEIKKLCRLDDNAQKFIEKASEKIVLTGRTYSKIIKTARTIADLNNCQQITIKEISEALQYRFID